MSTKDRGDMGEDIAVGFLEKNKYTIICRNWHCRWGEIDIVAIDNKEILVFVEVKTRAGNKFGLPEDAVDERKLEKMEKTIEEYLQENCFEGKYQIDVITIELDYKVRMAKLKHYKNIRM